MTFQNEHAFYVYYFQNIMDADCPRKDGDTIMFWQLRERVELCKEYQEAFNLHKYKTKVIWNTIHWYFNKNFMEIHFDLISPTLFFY